MTTSYPLKVGYARVSKLDQNPDLQRLDLQRRGCEPIIEEHGSGAKRDRPGLNHALGLLRRGDTFVVWKLDRLGRSLIDLVEIVNGLASKGVDFVSLHDDIDTTTPAGKLHFHIFAAFAEYERAMIIARTVPGLEAAREKGHFGGRRRVLTGARLVRAQQMRAERPINPATSRPYTDQEIAKLFKISRNTRLRYTEFGGQPMYDKRQERFIAEHPDVEAWLEKTDNPQRGTNPNKRRLSNRPVRVMTKEQAEAERDGNPC